MDCCCCFFLADVLFLTMAKRANEQQRGRYTAMWQQQRRDTMAKSFCPMKTDYKLLSCIEYLRTKETLDVGFQMFRRRSSRLLLPPYPLKIFSLVSGKKDRQTTIQWHVLKKTHNGKILLPYDDSLETSLLYRTLEDKRNPRGRFPSLQKLEPQIAAAAAAVFLQMLFLVNDKEDRQTAMWWQQALKKRQNGKILLPYEDRLRDPQSTNLFTGFWQGGSMENSEAV
jgi:hypothetical protein